MTKPCILDEEVERIRQNLLKTKAMDDLLRDTPEFQEQAKLFRNWLAHGSIVNIVGSLFDPETGADYKKLVWKNSGLNIVESLELLAKKVTEHAKETARVHKKLKIQHPELELKVIVEEGDKEVKK